MGQSFFKASRLLNLFMATMLVSGCSSNVIRDLYESIKTQNEANKTPAERAMNPTPNFSNYQKERDKLQQNNPAADKNESPEFILK